MLSVHNTHTGLKQQIPIFPEFVPTSLVGLCPPLLFPKIGRSSWGGCTAAKSSLRTRLLHSRGCSVPRRAPGWLPACVLQDLETFHYCLLSAETLKHRWIAASQRSRVLLLFTFPCSSLTHRSGGFPALPYSRGGAEPRCSSLSASTARVQPSGEPGQRSREGGRQPAPRRHHDDFSPAGIAHTARTTPELTLC